MVGWSYIIVRQYKLFEINSTVKLKLCSPPPATSVVSHSGCAWSHFSLLNVQPFNIKSLNRIYVIHVNLKFSHQWAVPGFAEKHIWALEAEITHSHIGHELSSNINTSSLTLLMLQTLKMTRFSASVSVLSCSIFVICVSCIFVIHSLMSHFFPIWNYVSRKEVWSWCDKKRVKMMKHLVWKGGELKLSRSPPPLKELDHC